MKSRVVLFVIAFFTWCLLNWVPDSQHLLVGVPVAALVAWLAGDLFIQRPFTLRQVSRYGTFLFVYTPVFLWEVIKANLDVAYRVLHPGLPITPGIVKITTTLKSDIALTVLANSITAKKD